MPRGKPVELDTIRFDTQKAATEHFQAMLRRYKPGDRISFADSADLAALLKRHESYAEKVGSGISHFEVMVADFNSRCFQVIRTDGTGADFSLHHCISGRRSSLEPAYPEFPIDLASLRPRLKK
jgi:hypothetical protein